MSGYSTTSLERKLGLKPNFNCRLIGAFPEFELWWSQLELSLMCLNTDLYDYQHLFVSEKQDLLSSLLDCKIHMKQNGMIWVSWPKKSSKIQSNMSEDIIRNTALENGLVDIKVCSINETWSALKLVIPLKLRDIHI